MSALYLLERIGGHRRRGVAVVLTAVLVVVLFGMVALTFDVGYLSNIRADLQHVADGTSLAGASAIGLEPDVIRARVHEYATKYRGLAKLSLADSDIVLGTWDANNGTFTPVANEDEDRVDAVRVFAEMSVARGNPAPLFFGTIFGKQLTNVSASATASFATGVAWNVVIVQDVTSSFKDDIPEARVADQALVDCIRDKAGGDTLVGLVTFTGYGQVVSPLEEVEASYDFISAAIAALDQCGRGSMPPCSGTNIAAGLVEA